MRMLSQPLFNRTNTVPASYLRPQAGNLQLGGGNGAYGLGSPGMDGFLGSPELTEEMTSAGGRPNGLQALAQCRQLVEAACLVSLLSGLMAGRGQDSMGMNAARRAGSGQRQGNGDRVVELQKGQSYTTPGGATIAWSGDEVKVNEPGGRNASSAASAASATARNASASNAPGPRTGNGNVSALALALSMSLGSPEAAGGVEGCSPSRQFGVSVAFSMAAALANSGQQTAMNTACGMTGSSAAAAAASESQSAPRSWRVWGDPHIDHPDGSKSDFDHKNAMFTLQDGTRVLMGADNPKGVVEKVQIVLPGGEPNWEGYDPKQTSVMQDNGKGHFDSIGTADQMMV